jgi:maleylpyruvate isomerase
MSAIPPTDWATDLDMLREQTALLCESIATLDDDQVGQASSLPGWTRGHVLAHLDGNAKGLGRLVRWARDGVERPMYISRQVRDADVEVHAGRSARSHAAAVDQSARELEEDLQQLTPQHRDGQVTLGNGLEVRASSLARHRLQEVCVHHADLGLPGYTWRDWPVAMAAHMTRLVAADFADRGEFPVATIRWEDPGDAAGGDSVSIDIVPGDTMVHGPAPAILAWLLGRSSGEDLSVVGLAHLPPAPTWR